MTPEEAKTKWCPFARTMVTIDGQNNNPLQGFSANRFRDDKIALCIADACMAWRWSRAKETRAFLAAVQETMKAQKIDFAKATQIVFADRGATFEETEGYCGLASKPE